MSLIKLNNRAVKDVTQFGSITSLGSLTHISTATASASASIEFTSGIDSTYKEYIFYFVNIHRSANTFFAFNMSTDGGSNYNVAKTTTFFDAYHNESGADSALQYIGGWDLAQGTGFQRLANGQSGNSDESTSGYLHLFNPSSSTYVKHFIARSNSNNSPYSEDYYVAGYGNTTSPVNAIKFQMESGNIDAGQILLFGVN
jgi:hypothetical protein